MAPRSFPAATLAVTVLVAVACPVASADSPDDAAVGESPSGAADGTAASGTSDGGVQTLAQDTGAAVAGATNDVLTAPAVAPPSTSDASPAPPVAPAPPPGSSAAATPQEPAATTRANEEAPPPKPPTLGGEASRAPSTTAPPAQPHRPEPIKAVVTAAPPPPVSSASKPDDVAPAPPKPAPGLEGLFTDADRGLREVQGQIGALKRRLDAGGPPPPVGLVRLREGLERIAPVLLALEAQLYMTGPLAPRLQTLLHRVRSRLERTQGSARDLIAAFAHSGTGGRALQMLLRELDRFVAFNPAPATTPAAWPGPGPLAAPAPAPYAAYTPIEVSPAAAAPDGGVARTSGRRASGRPDTGPEDPVVPEEAPPSSPASGSASASPGGALFAAGLASLAALLAALALPGLRVRLELLAGRAYRAVFLSPLERPG